MSPHINNPWPICMGETANPRSSTEFAQYQWNAFKCRVMLGSLWALINTCKLAYLLALSHGERGGVTVRQRQSPGQSELNLRFAHEWACDLCLPGGTWWGWDNGTTSGWQTEGIVRSEFMICQPQSFSWERKSRPNTFSVLIQARDVCNPASPTLHIFLEAVTEGGEKN